MGGVTDMLFGSTTPAQQVGNAPVLTQGQTDLLDQLTSLLGGELGQPGPVYNQSTVAGDSDLQKLLYGNLSNAFGSGGLSGTAETALSTSLGNFDPSSVTDYFNTNVKDPMTKNWMETILPQIKESFIGQNAGRSGAANRAIADSGADLASSMTAELNNLLYTGEQSALNRQVSGGQNLLSSLLGNTALAGGTQQSTETSGLQDLYRMFQEGQDWNNPALNFLNTAFGTKAFEPMVQGATQQSGLVQDLAPLAMMMMML